ncbi:RagB/SusD family nutrient uptake outer membrane protein [Rhodocytophaga aerolata]|uniref:RagB/SusD family nutrient uptake outer membrane protein n=1 Tax=Rhodocytophaga aerolata TaxID=455078 RepID=A0ABT8REA6_9BACT|nr:RagB/SusD family nutrient uptake outer membrane protein [Rhodocytophaga aerolata]MDO1449679.1 RagB/SusD family nutrient uptake outer membrane protein [Rhodocytophaga aerolata]
MKTFISKYILAIFFVAFFSSCEDFLNEVPQTARSAENFYKTGADFNNAIIGAYANFKHPGLYGNGGTNASMLWLTEVVSDNSTHGATKAVSNLSQFELDEFNISLSNTVTTSAWTGHYIGIGRVNTILDKLPAAAFDEALKARYEGEARFLRAYNYFNLVRLFGDVQLIDKGIDNPYGANDITRTDASVIYDLIINDLTIAENNLPATIPAVEAGRTSKWAAKALLGKVYLTRNQLDLAAQKLNEVITSGQFNLSTPYAATFSPATSYTNNKDVILAVQYKTGLVGQGSALWSDLTPWGVQNTLFGTTGSGGGFMQPTADMENAYEPGDLRKEASMQTAYKAANGSTVNVRHVVKYKQEGPQAGDADTDFPLLRYADVLLMYAEALNNQGQTSAAEPFLNQVRARAGLPEKTGLSQADFSLAVEQERRVELAFEGHRWFDLLRTGRYVEVMKNKGYPVQEFHYLYPIPQRETDLNSQLTQNPGY